MDNRKFFDAGYSIPYEIVSTTANHLVCIATTGGYYHGCVVESSAADCTVHVYNNIGTTKSSVVDIIYCNTATSMISRNMLRSPVYYNAGLLINISEDGGKGIIFYTPKG